jgi:hypothetical protein
VDVCGAVEDVAVVSIWLVGGGVSTAGGTDAEQPTSKVNPTAIKVAPIFRVPIRDRAEASVLMAPPRSRPWLDTLVEYRLNGFPLFDK